MNKLSHSRRQALAASVGLVGCTALAETVVAQSGPVINDPSVVREVEAAFQAYYQALTANDVAALNRFFYEGPFTVRYGNAEILYGYQEIASYRSALATPPTAPKQERTVITTFGKDFATASTLNRRQTGKIGRTMQTWVRFPQGWRIVAAHVSTIDEPVKAN